MLENELYHHGVPHQRWGVKNGPPYPIKRGHETHYTLSKMSPDTRKHVTDTRKDYALRTREDVESIFNTFSKKDKRLLDAGEDDSEYMGWEATAYWVYKRFMVNNGDVPVGWLDIIKSPKGGEANIAIGVRSDYRGQGYASQLAKQGAEWIDAHMDEFSKVNWGAYKENEASIRLAKQNGFVLDNETDSFATYSKRS